MEEFREAFAASNDAELNGLFGEDVTFSIIGRKRDDTLVEEWLPAEGNFGRETTAAKRLGTTLSANAPVVSLTSPRSPSTASRAETEADAPRRALPPRPARARLESLFPDIEWGKVGEEDLFIDASGVLVDSRGNPILSGSGNLVRIDDSQFALFCAS